MLGEVTGMPNNVKWSLPPRACGLPSDVCFLPSADCLLPLKCRRSTVAPGSGACATPAFCLLHWRGVQVSGSLGPHSSLGQDVLSTGYEEPVNNFKN
jgi:hypothetical protein